MTLYLCFLAGGSVLPILSFIFGFLGDGADADIDADIDVDIDMDTDLDVSTEADAGMDTGSHMDVGHASDTGPGIDVETETGSIFAIGLIPTSLMSLSALAITFGAVGALMTYTGKGRTITIVAAVIAGYLASVIVQTIMKTLKRAQRRNEGVDENELLLYDGKVVDTILPGQLGTVSFTTLNNVLISYPARCADEKLKLETGRIVTVAEKKNGIFIVEPKNKYE